MLPLLLAEPLAVACAPPEGPGIGIQPSHLTSGLWLCAKAWRLLLLWPPAADGGP